MLAHEEGALWKISIWSSPFSELLTHSPRIPCGCHTLCQVWQFQLYTQGLGKWPPQTQWVHGELDYRLVSIDYLAPGSPHSDAGPWWHIAYPGITVNSDLCVRVSEMSRSLSPVSSHLSKWPLITLEKDRRNHHGIYLLCDSILPMDAATSSVRSENCDVVS